MTAHHYKDMTMDEYQSSTDAQSKSMLSELADCPARYKHRYIDGNAKPKTEALHIGSAVHTLALEPEKWKAGYYVMPTTYFNDKGEKKPWRNDKRMKVYQDAMLEAGYDMQKDEDEGLIFNPGPKAKLVLDTADYQMIEQMAESLTKDPFALSLLKAPGYVESSVFWDQVYTDPDSGEVTTIKMKMRPDLMRNDGVMPDIKTARSVNPDIFFRDSLENNYDLSVAISFAGYEALHGKEPDNYVFVAIEKEAPFLVSCFETVMPMGEVSNLSYLDYGRAHLNHLLKKYIDCKKTGVWPGYVDKIETMKIPNWAMQKFMMDGF